MSAESVSSVAKLSTSQGQQHSDLQLGLDQEMKLTNELFKNGKVSSPVREIEKSLNSPLLKRQNAEPKYTSFWQGSSSSDTSPREPEIKVQVEKTKRASKCCLVM